LVGKLRESETTRLNDPKEAALVVVMQRLHEDDVSGAILSSEWSPDWVCGVFSLLGCAQTGPVKS
jgi:hypothetical protein